MSEPTILIVPPQGITAADKRALAKIGVVVIEMDDPQQARLIKASSEVTTTDMLAAAATAIMEAGKTHTIAPRAFGEAICSLLTEPRRGGSKGVDGCCRISYIGSSTE